MPVYGRGGAGNIQVLTQEKDRIATDLEANKTIEEPTSSSQLPNTARGSNLQYAYAGRGGAGNFYSAKDKNNVQPPAGRDDSSSTRIYPGKSTQPPGRGGAGNYEFATDGNIDAAAIERVREQRSRERTTQDVEKVVEQQLAVPPKAKLAQTPMQKR